MRFIAVVGVLLVLASCSDSDIPDNFSVSCYQVGAFDEQLIVSYDFDFDNNIVTEKLTLGGTIYNFPLRYDITEITSTTISFGLENQELTLNRADLSLKYYMYAPKVSHDYRCRTPQV